MFRDPWRRVGHEDWRLAEGREVDGRAYADLKDARAHIGAFIEDVYNADRLHSALGYKLPMPSRRILRKLPPRTT
jgi:Integrase core domain